MTQRRKGPKKVESKDKFHQDILDGIFCQVELFEGLACKLFENNLFNPKNTKITFLFVEFRGDFILNDENGNLSAWKLNTKFD